MSDPDVRSLCAELVSAFDCVSDSEEASGYERLKDAIEDLRAALAQPAPEPTFTDEEVEMHSAPWSYLNPAPKVPTGAELTALVRVFQAAYNAKRSELRYLPTPYWEETVSDLADHAGISAVLARWGQGNG